MRAQFELSYHIEDLFFYKNKMLEIKDVKPNMSTFRRPYINTGSLNSANGHLSSDINN